MPETDRRALHAYLSDDAHEAWHEIAAELGVSVSGMLEALASGLGSDGEPAGVPLGQDTEATVKRARRIDAERRRR